MVDCPLRSDKTIEVGSSDREKITGRVCQIWFVKPSCRSEGNLKRSMR